MGDGDWGGEVGCVADEGVELAALAAGVGGVGQVVEERCVVLAAGEVGRDLFGVDAGEGGRSKGEVAV